MLRLVLAAVMVLAAGGALSEVPLKEAPLTSDDLFLKQSRCKGIGDIAATIMTERQREVPMSEMISRMQQADALGIFDGIGFSMNTVLGLITIAYNQKAFIAKDLQSEMVAGFRNQVELKCYEGVLAPAP